MVFSTQPVNRPTQSLIQGSSSSHLNIPYLPNKTPLNIPPSPILSATFRASSANVRHPTSSDAQYASMALLNVVVASHSSSSAG